MNWHWERAGMKSNRSGAGLSQGVSPAGDWQWEAAKIDQSGRARSVDTPPAMDELVGFSSGASPAGQLKGGPGFGLTWAETQTCAFCRGAGEKPRGAKCSVCKGKGSVPVKPPAKSCAYCHGRGEERPRTNITCTVCKGKGVVSVAEPIVRCGRCKGTGAEPTNKLPCIGCKGTGVVTAVGLV